MTSRPHWRLSRSVIWISLTLAACSAQPLSVYSDLARLDASGKLLAPETPREILSPALVRNGFTSFQIAVTAPPGVHWRLFIGQNPENAVMLTVYKEAGERLEKVALPAEGQSPAVFWMDVWAAKGASVSRIKIEPQLDDQGDWIIYPVEGRVMDATVPDGPLRSGTDAPVAVMRQLLCGDKPASAPATSGPPNGAAQPPTLALLRNRNAQQDLTLAGLAPRGEVAKVFGSCASPAPADPEWYLHVRDYLFRLR